MCAQIKPPNPPTPPTYTRLPPSSLLSACGRGAEIGGREDDAKRGDEEKKKVRKGIERAREGREERDSETERQREKETDREREKEKSERKTEREGQKRNDRQIDRDQQTE